MKLGIGALVDSTAAYPLHRWQRQRRWRPPQVEELVATTTPQTQTALE
jgi:hypothetical protein